MDANKLQTHRNFKIVRNECGWFNVPTINCWSSPTVASAMKAIDAHLARVNADSMLAWLAAEVEAGRK